MELTRPSSSLATSLPAGRNSCTSEHAREKGRGGALGGAGWSREARWAGGAPSAAGKAAGSEMLALLLRYSSHQVLLGQQQQRSGRADSPTRCGMAWAAQHACSAQHAPHSARSAPG